MNSRTGHAGGVDRRRLRACEGHMRPVVLDAGARCAPRRGRRRDDPAQHHRHPARTCCTSRCVPSASSTSPTRATKTTFARASGAGPRRRRRANRSAPHRSASRITSFDVPGATCPSGGCRTALCSTGRRAPPRVQSLGTATPNIYAFNSPALKRIGISDFIPDPVCDVCAHAILRAGLPGVRGLDNQCRARGRLRGVTRVPGASK